MRKSNKDKALDMAAKTVVGSLILPYNEGYMKALVDLGYLDEITIRELIDRFRNGLKKEFASSTKK